MQSVLRADLSAAVPRLRRAGGAANGVFAAACWRETAFVIGLVCDKCGCPLPGRGERGHQVLCDDCLIIARPWDRGRAALLYKVTGGSWYWR